MNEMIFKIPYFIYDVENHSDIKTQILDVIARSEYSKPSNTFFEKISKSDYHTQEANYYKTSNGYIHLLTPHINNIIQKIIPDTNKQNLKIDNFWFHQYNRMEYYWWHNHPGARWAIVYYVEMDGAGPITEFENFYGPNITPNVKEGQILIFPGWIKHRSPPNLSNNRKTIISVNIIEIFKDVDSL